MGEFRMLAVVPTELADELDERQPRKRDESAVTSRDTIQLARERFIVKLLFLFVECEDLGKWE